MNVYQIESRSKYLVVIKRIRDIEDAGDDFVTEDELREEFGVTRGGRGNFHEGVPTLKTPDIVAALTELRDKMIADGKRSILVKDDELIEMFKESNSSVSDFMTGLRRVGNRLYLHEDNKPRAKKSHVNTLAYRVTRTVMKNHQFELDIKYASQDVAGVVLLCKKLVSWDDIDFGTVHEDLIGFMKEIWDNPTMFDKQ